MWDSIINFLMVDVNKWILAVGDLLFDWMLDVPRDLALLIIAVMTGVVMTIIRRFTTNQDKLKRCEESQAKLKAQMAEAKKRRDKEEKLRIRSVTNQISMMKLTAEGKPLLFSLLPILVIAVWAFSRIAFIPPTPEDKVDVIVYFDSANIGQLATLLPQDGIDIEGPAIRRIETSYNLQGQTDGGMAKWTISAAPRPQPYELAFRFKGSTISAQYQLDGRSYAPPAPMCDNNADVIMTEFKLKPYKPLGAHVGLIDNLWNRYLTLPGWEGLRIQDFLAPWLLGYLILVVPLTFILKPALRTY